MTALGIRKTLLRSVVLMILLAGATGAAVGQNKTRTVQPGAPGEATRVINGADATAQTQIGHTEADVRFMQGMIHHHVQALEMTALVPERTEKADIRLLARRIESSQADEIALMQRWLATRGEDVPAGHVDEHQHHAGHHHHHHHHHDLMPGMLTPGQMAELAAATGEDFDRLFLEFMIFHHEGALIMVDELVSSEGGGQEPAVFDFASHVDSDQRIEIARMRAMLHASTQPDTE